MTVFGCLLLSGCRWLSRHAAGPHESPSHTIKHTGHAENRRNQQQELEQLERLVRQSPDNLDLRRQLVLAHLENGNPTTAREVLRRIEANRFDDAEDCVLFAGLARRCGDHRLSDEYVKTALANDPAHVTALSLQAKRLEDRRERLAAIAVYHQILENDPEHVEARLKLAAHHLKYGKPEQAAILFRAVKNEPELSDSLKRDATWQLGVAYGRTGRWNEAAQSMQQTIAMVPAPTAEQYYALAQAHRRSGNSAAAAEALKHSLQIAPKHRPSHELLATLALGE